MSKEIKVRRLIETPGIPGCLGTNEIDTGCLLGKKISEITVVTTEVITVPRRKEKKVIEELSGSQ